MTTSSSYQPSLGVRRRLAAIADAKGRITMLAIDHRQNLMRALGEETTPDQLTDFKLDVIRALGPAASSILTDPEYGAAQAITDGALAGGRGLVLALEATGYVPDGGDRVSMVLDGWSVDQALALGADGVKLLIYYHPDGATAPRHDELVGSIAEQCRAHSLPLFVEPLSYQPGGGPVPDDELADVVVETAARLTAIGGDVLKAEFPSRHLDPAEWETPLARLGEASQIPWVILSGGVPFERFADQATAAAHHGCCGVMVGRAVWNEAVELTGAERTSFLTTTARHRLDVLAAIDGPGWHDHADTLDRPGAEWFRQED